MASIHSESIELLEQALLKAVAVKPKPKTNQKIKSKLIEVNVGFNKGFNSADHEI